MQCLRGPTECDQAIGAQFAQMLRQRRLAQFHDANQFSHRHLATRGQKAKNQQPLFIAEQFQQLCGLAGLLRQLLQISGIADADSGGHSFRCCCNGSHGFLSRSDLRAGQSVRARPTLPRCQLVSID